MVTLIGLDQDLHLDAVLSKLEDVGESVVRIDPTRVTRENTRLTFNVGNDVYDALVETYAGAFRPAEISGVLCRYAIDSLESSAADSVDRFADAEFLAALLGVLRTIPSERWINDPYLESRADNKLYQLASARSEGLAVPSSAVTNDRAHAESFLRSTAPCIVKAISDLPLTRNDGHYSVSNVVHATKPTYGLYTAPFDERTLQEKDSDISCPTLFQQQLKGAEIRATVIDDYIYSAQVVRHSHHSSVDFRNDPGATTLPYELPTEVGARLRSLIRRLGLRYAACDLIACQDRFYFLEANSSGNWLWTEHEAGLPISSCLGNALRSVRVSASRSSQ